MIRLPPRSKQRRSSAASDVYKRQGQAHPPQVHDRGDDAFRPGPHHVVDRRRGRCHEAHRGADGRRDFHILSDGVDRLPGDLRDLEVELRDKGAASGMKRKTAGKKNGRSVKRACWLPILLLCLGLVFWGAARPAEAALRIGGTLPSTVIPGIEGSAVRIPEVLRGKGAVLHFWQTRRYSWLLIRGSLAGPTGISGQAHCPGGHRRCFIAVRRLISHSGNGFSSAGHAKG